jgi:hypothetical protein
MTDDSEHIEASEPDSQPDVVISAENLINEDWQPPNRCIRDFVETAFDVGGLRTFCQDYFQDVFRRIDEKEGFDAIVSKLIAYCDQRGITQELWVCFRKERPKSGIDSYYARWQKSTRKNAGRMDDYNLVQRRVVAQAVSETGSSPYDKSEADLARWFFGELASEERSLVLGVALMEGMTRAKLMKVATDIRVILENGL